MLKRRFETDPTYQSLVAQYVYLHIDLSKQQDEKQKWFKAFPLEGKTIGMPYVNVVKYDGSLLYTKHGGITSDKMAELLKQAGRRLTESELAKVKRAISMATSYLAEDKIDQAIATLTPAVGTGGIDEEAKQADDLAKQIVERGEQTIARAEEQFASADTVVDAWLALLKANRDYRKLPKIAGSLKETAAIHRADASKKRMLAAAMMIERADSMAAAKRGTQAANLYKTIGQRYADSRAAEIAQQRFEALAATVPSTTKKTTTPSVSTLPYATRVKKASSYLRMARVFAKKSPAKAKEYAQKAIDVAPDSDSAKEAKSLLDGF